MSLTSPHDILSVYSNGRISSGDAISKLHLDGYRDLTPRLRTVASNAAQA
jgi:hypothetical protein